MALRLTGGAGARAAPPRRRRRELADANPASHRHRARLGLKASALITVVGLLVAAGASAAAGASRDVSSVPVYRVAVRKRIVALSFDDGPDPRWTPTVLATLAQYGAHATFFDVGQNVARYPALVSAELQAGNEVGDHTWSHTHLLRLAGRAMATEVDAGNRAVAAVSGRRPDLFRPPYGEWNDAVRDAAADAGMRTVLWSVCLERFVNHHPIPQALAALEARVGPGTIILAHDGGVPSRSASSMALPLLLRALTSKGYRVVTVGQLLASGGRS